MNYFNVNQQIDLLRESRITYMTFAEPLLLCVNCSLMSLQSTRVYEFLSANVTLIWPSSANSFNVNHQITLLTESDVTDTTSKRLLLCVASEMNLQIGRVLEFLEADVTADTFILH